MSAAEMSEIVKLEQKIERLAELQSMQMQDQAEFKKSVTENLVKLTETVTKLDVQQVQINHLEQAQIDLRHAQERAGQRLGELEKTISVVEDFRGDAKMLKRTLITGMVSLVVGILIYLYKG